MKRAIAVVAGVVVVAYLVSPLVIGLIAQRQFPETLEALNVGAPEWQPGPFHLGYRHSSADSTLTIPVSGGQPLVIHLHHRITQGLGSDLSIMKVTTTPTVKRTTRAQLDRLFGGKRPLVVETRIFADGHYTSTITAAAIANRSLPGEPTVHLAFAGLAGTVSGTFHPRSASYRLTSPGFELLNDKTHLRIAASGLRLSGDVRVPRPWLRLGDGRFSMDKVVFAAAGQPATEVDGLRLAAKEQRETDGLGFHYDIHMAQLSGPPALKVTNLALEVAGHHLDEKSTEQFARRLAAISRMGLPAAQVGPMLHDALQQVAGGFLAHSPEIGIRRLAFDLPTGGVRASVDARFDGAGFKSVADPGNLQRLSVEASLKAPATAVRALLIGLMRPKAAAYAKAVKPDATPAEVAALGVRMADQTIRNLQARHLLQSEGGNYASSLTFRDGALTVNGQPMALPALPASAR